MRNMIFRIFAGIVGLFLFVSVFVGPGPDNPWFHIVALVIGGVFLYFAFTGKSSVARRSQESE